MDLFHGLQVAIMFALMTNILQFAWWKCKAKKVEGHWNKFGPCYLLMIALVLVMIQPTCMLVIGSYGLLPFLPGSLAPFMPFSLGSLNSLHFTDSLTRSMSLSHP